MVTIDKSGTPLVMQAVDLQSFLSAPVDDDSSLRADCESLLLSKTSSVRTFFC